MSSGSSSEDEWEDVEPLPEGELLTLNEEDGPGGQSSSSSQPPPAGSLEIVLQNKGLRGKGKGKEVNYVEKALAAFHRELYSNMHQVNLLCLVARGLILSRQCNDIIMKSCLLSIIGAEKKDLVFSNTDLYTQDSITKLLDWFSKRRSGLRDQLKDETDSEAMTDAQLLVTALRAIGLRARLVMVLNPISFKPPSTKSTAKQDTGENEQNKTSGKEAAIKSEGIKMSDSHSSLEVEGEIAGKGKAAARDREGVGKKSSRKRRGSSSGSQQAAKKAKTNKHSPYFKKQQNKKKGLKRKSSEMEPSCKDSRESDAEYNPDDEGSKSVNISLISSEDDDIVEPVRKKKRKNSKTTCASPAKKLKQAVEESSNSESKTKSSTSSQRRTSSEVEVQDVEDTSSWAEVYLSSGEKKKRWLSVHPLSGSVGQPQLCEKHCTIPLRYVVTFETGCHGDIVRDVTARYASGWCTNTRKHRTSQEWWVESLRPFEPSDLEEKEDEEEDILSMLYAQPLPTAISDFKNHPLYALRRHLLKFEAIYPEDSQVIGYCKGEPVYARECVHTLHTRETWLKEGRVVRRGEKAYNIVKARTKKGQSVLEAQNNTVEVFGRWQTEEYMPAPVVNGKVPRNEYGNLELFKPSMLPVGAAHIPIQGIQKVARKLDIDSVPAVTGWDFHSGYCHPVIEGVVVAKEFKEILLEAWQQEEQLSIEREIKKREKRVIERWRKLVRGLLVRERVKRTYSSVSTDHV